MYICIISCNFGLLKNNLITLYFQNFTKGVTEELIIDNIIYDKYNSIFKLSIFYILIKAIIDAIITALITSLK